MNALASSEVPNPNCIIQGRRDENIFPGGHIQNSTVVTLESKAQIAIQGVNQDCEPNSYDDVGARESHDRCETSDEMFFLLAKFMVQWN